MTLTDPRPRALALDLPRECIFDAADLAILARYWYPTALSREVSTAPLAATLFDEFLVAYRAGNDVVVAHDICPHRAVPLSAGTGDGATVACAYHGIRCGAGVACVSVPAPPPAKIPARPVRTLGRAAALPRTYSESGTMLAVGLALVDTGGWGCWVVRWARCVRVRRACSARRSA
jgi:hypothetical protein